MRIALKTQLELLSNETQARDEEKAHIKAAQARIKQAEVAVAEAKLRLRPHDNRGSRGWSRVSD